MPESNTEPLVFMPLGESCIPMCDDPLRNELVRDTVFFAIPTPLLNAVVDEIGRDKFDGDRLEIEYKLSARCGDHSATVGFWRGAPIEYPLLQPPPMPKNEEECAREWGMEVLKEVAAEWGMTVPHIANCLRIAGSSTAWVHTISRGYVGWLLTSSRFLQEHDSLFAEWHNEVREWGIPKLGPLVAPGMVLPGMQEITNDRQKRFGQAFTDFLLRWRLLRLTAPYLPVPMGPLMTGDLPASVLGQLRHSGGFFFLPDIFPIPSRDQLRQLLDDGLRGAGGPEHLAEWTKMIGRSNPAKNAIAAFARRFQLQHYWKLFHLRHRNALDRNVTKLKSAFAGFLGIELRVLMNDLAFLKKTLGADWESRSPMLL